MKWYLNVTQTLLILLFDKVAAKEPLTAWERFCDGFKTTILGNLPEIIGVTVAAILIAIFVWFRDKIFGRSKPTSALPDSRPASPLISVEYLKDVIEINSNLNFGNPTLKVKSTNSNITLEQVWIPLRVSESSQNSFLSISGEGIYVEELFKIVTENVLILGDPGSGKSTSLALLAVNAARKSLSDGNQKTPVKINVAGFQAENRVDEIGNILTTINELDAAYKRSEAEGTKLRDYLRQRILEGKALFLIDGLDEVKEHSIHRFFKCINHLINLNIGNQFIVTCRKFDYRQTKGRVLKVPIKREVEILPYNLDDKKAYIDLWYGAATLCGRFNNAEAIELSAALKLELNFTDLADLADLPLLMTLLTVIHSEEGKLPDTRAVVCSRAIKYMLADSAQWRRRNAGEGTIATGPILSLAIKVAHYIHHSEEKNQNVGHGHANGITKQIVNDFSKQICDLLAIPQFEREVPDPEEIADKLLQSHGLLLEIDNGIYRFSHRYFQEFLAGQFYSQGAHPVNAIEKAHSLHWREPFRLMASLSGHEGENLYYILKFICELLVSDDIALCQLAGEMLSEIGKRRLMVRDFGFIVDSRLGGDAELSGLWDRLRDKIADLATDPETILLDRYRAGVTLGLLGDIRFLDNDGTAIGPWLQTLEVMATTRKIGTDRISQIDQLNAGAPRTVGFQEFRIGKFLVTNLQYHEFIADGGYTNVEYWKSPRALGWLKGEKSVIDELRAHWISTVYQHHEKEIRDGEISTSMLEDEAERRIAPRQYPFYWNDRRFNQTNQPIIGINYWEAAAYCEWATQKGHAASTLNPIMKVCLPTEFEWECASRPRNDDRVYPWGNLWNEQHAHVSSNLLNIRQPAPVGIYLEPKLDVPLDMAGNVWEWMATLNFPYAPEHDKLRLSDNSIEERVVKGSSWYNTPNLSACSARAIDRAYNLFYDVGFRIIIIPQEAERACCY
jgi:formylglycine-generating enzyme required for sulfatase activity